MPTERGKIAVKGKNCLSWCALKQLESALYGKAIDKCYWNIVSDLLSYCTLKPLVIYNFHDDWREISFQHMTLRCKNLVISHATLPCMSPPKQVPVFHHSQNRLSTTYLTCQLFLCLLILNFCTNCKETRDLKILDIETPRALVCNFKFWGGVPLLRANRTFHQNGFFSLRLHSGKTMVSS